MDRRGKRLQRHIEGVGTECCSTQKGAQSSLFEARRIPPRSTLRHIVGPRYPDVRQSIGAEIEHQVSGCAGAKVC